MPSAAESDPSWRRGRSGRPDAREITCPALFLGLAFALGIALESVVGAPAPTLWRMVPVLMASAAVCLIGSAILIRAGREGLAAAVVLAGFMLAGAAAQVLFVFRFSPNHVSRLEDWRINLARPVRVEGSVLTEPVPTPSGVEFDLEAARLVQPEGAAAQPRAVSGKIRVRVESFAGSGAGETAAPDIFNLHPGDRVVATMELRRPQVYQNPGSFDFRQRAATIEDLYWEGSVTGADEIRKLPSPSGFDGRRAIWSVRRRLRNGIDRLYPPWSTEGRDGAVLKAILLGDRSALDSTTIDHFRVSGLYHLLVIAGLHVGLIAGLVLGLLRLLGLTRTWRDAGLLLILGAYALVVEQRAPTLRATLMIAAFVAADLLNRDRTALNSVGLAALILLLARPAWLFESGFQLSFAAALLIVGLAGPILRGSIEPYRRALGQLDNVDRDVALAPRQAQFRLDLRALVAAVRERSGFLDGHSDAARRLITWPLGGALRLLEIAVLSLVLQIGLLLPMVETFHRVTLAGIGLNSLALPLMAVLLAVAIPTVALAAVAPSWAVAPGKVLAVVFKALFWLAEIPHLPAWLSYRVPSPPVAVAIGFALSLVVLALSLGRTRAGAICSSVAFCFFAVLLATEPFAAEVPTGSLELTALDCGRGRATFLVLPDGATMLVDAGGAARAGGAKRWDPGENIVAPYLWSRRVKSIDVLAVPGPSVDGVASILEDFKVRELWLASGFRGPVTSDLGAIIDRGRRRGVNVREIAPGETLRLGSTFVVVAGSYGSARASDPIPSLTLRITNGGDSAWLAGASASVGPLPLADSGMGPRNRILVIDRPGLAAARRDLPGSIDPQVAIVTPGRTLAEDAAAREALPGLSLGRVQVLETASSGAVTVEMKGRSLRIRTFRSGWIPVEPRGVPRAGHGG